MENIRRTFITSYDQTKYTHFVALEMMYRRHWFYCFIFVFFFEFLTPETIPQMKTNETKRNVKYDKAIIRPKQVSNENGIPCKR